MLTLDTSIDTERTREHTARIVQILSLQDDASSVHRVQRYRDGLRVPVALREELTVYVYALPWARGWAVFSSTRDDAGSYSWRDVPKRFASLQRALYAPRGAAGPWHVPPAVIAGAVAEIAQKLEQRRARYREAS